MGRRQIDCVVIGHNEIGVSRYNQLIRLIYGKNSKNYGETAKYNLSHIRTDRGYLTPAQVFNLVKHDDPEQVEIADTFSLTIAYLCSFLYRYNFTFDYVNTFHRPADQDKLRHLLEHCDVGSVALTTTYYLNVVPMLDIVRFVRTHNPAVKVIIGGPFVRNQVMLLSPDKLQSVFNTLNADYYVDSGEGEQTLGQLLDAIRRQQPLDSVPNLYLRSARNSPYVATAKSLEANDLSVNSVNWTLFRDDIKDIVNIRTTKSCPFRCSFCSFPGAAGRYKVMDLDKVEQELDMLHSINPDLGLDFIDDTFNIPRQRFADLLRMMIRKKYNFKWYAFYKAQLAEREVTRLMKEAGCTQVFLGCESGSQTILDNLRKDSKIGKYYEAFEYLHEFALLSIASFIVGFPGETEATYRETFDFIEKTRPTFFRTRLWWYDTGAPVHQQREEFDLHGSGYEWNHFTMDSTAAQKLADEMILGIGNSIHATDYPIPFEMITKGVPAATTEAFMARFRDYLHAALRSGGQTQVYSAAEIRAEFGSLLAGGAARSSPSVSAVA